MNTSESQNSNIPNNDSRPLYTISIAAKLTNTAISTLRMYEDRGLILPHKTKTKRRLYSDVDINRILCIRKHLDEEGLNIAATMLMKQLSSATPLEIRSRTHPVHHSTSSSSWCLLLQLYWLVQDNSESPPSVRLLNRVLLDNLMSRVFEAATMLLLLLCTSILAGCTTSSMESNDSDSTTVEQTLLPEWEVGD
jgi:DNA-binding transcriptional MerR regulator